MNTLHVIFRTCTRVGALNANRFGSKRPFTDSKRELVLTCLNSLLDSLGKNGVVHVLDDHSPKKDTDAIRKLLKSYGSTHSTSSGQAGSPQSGNMHRFVPLEKKGGGHSFGAALEYARKAGFPLVYFCEDDYLHLPHAISSMIDCLRGTKLLYFRLIILKDIRCGGRTHHPRRITIGIIYHTTFTFMIENRILEKY